MKKTEVLKQLKAMGTAQNRKVYARHGVKGDMYGVSYANLGKLTKTIRVDHHLAESLWATGNHDARVLATMIADPARVTARQLDAWVKDLDNYVLTDALSGLAGKTTLARKRMEQWTRAGGEWTGAAGWNILAHLAMSDDTSPDAYFEKYLKTISDRIHKSKNRVKHAMNNALIAIGIRNPGLERKAMAVAGKIGKVEVDHGETGCKTPDAAAYIRKTVARKKKKALKK